MPRHERVRKAPRKVQRDVSTLRQKYPPTGCKGGSQIRLLLWQALNQPYPAKPVQDKHAGETPSRLSSRSQIYARRAGFETRLRLKMVALPALPNTCHRIRINPVAVITTPHLRNDVISSRSSASGAWQK